MAADLGVTIRHGADQRNRRLPEDTGSGLAWGDYDADGDFDLYVVNHPHRAPGQDDVADSNRLYRNDGTRFVDVTVAAGVGDPGGFGVGASFADYDADGDVDLYVTNDGPNRLFRNRGDGSFDEVAELAGVADSGWSTGVTWGDLDRDGDLDLYVCNYLQYDVPEEAENSEAWEGIPVTLNPNAYDAAPNSLFLNRGDGKFDECAERFEVHNDRGRSLAASFCDLDGDGWLDLYVNNDVSQNVLFKNTGAEAVKESDRFLEISAITGTADPRGSMGLSVGDVSGAKGRPDGYPDLFITHWIAQENALYIGVPVSQGDVEFRDRVRRFRLGEISTGAVGWGCAMVDLDLDGATDIAVANGSTLEDKKDPDRLLAEPLFLFWRSGRRFWNLAPAAGRVASARHVARGLAAADWDGDGDVDLAVAVNRGTPLLLRNDTETENHSLTVRLDGPASACFGARIEVVAGGTSSYRWQGSDVSYLSMHSSDALFGLGEQEHADAIRVSWADGSRSQLDGKTDGPHRRPALSDKSPSVSSSGLSPMSSLHVPEPVPEPVPDSSDSQSRVRAPQELTNRTTGQGVPIHRNSAVLSCESSCPSTGASATACYDPTNLRGKPTAKPIEKPVSSHSDQAVSLRRRRLRHPVDAILHSIEHDGRDLRARLGLRGAKSPRGRRRDRDHGDRRDETLAFTPIDSPGRSWIRAGRDWSPWSGSRPISFREPSTSRKS